MRFLGKSIRLLSLVVPSEAPQNVNGKMLNSTSIEITWLPPAAGSRNGVLTGYRLLYDEAVASLELDNATAHSIVVTESAFVLSGLEKFTPYKISVAAMTRPGIGPYSDVIIVKTDEDGR